MQLSDKNILQLKELVTLLETSFKGSSFGNLKIDDAKESLIAAIDFIENRQTSHLDEKQKMQRMLAEHEQNGTLVEFVKEYHPDMIMEDGTVSKFLLAEKLNLW